MPSNCFLLDIWNLSPPNRRISKLFVIARLGFVCLYKVTDAKWTNRSTRFVRLWKSSITDNGDRNIGCGAASLWSMHFRL
jgi:hypothetical protein